MKTVLIFSILCTSIFARHHRNHHHHHHDANHIGFYWEDFKQESLDYAVKGGKDSHDKVTYIGLAKHTIHRKELLVPGIIYPDQDLMVYELNQNAERLKKEFTVNFKILCTKYPDHMVWIPTDTEGIKKLLHDKELIPAGYDEHHKKYYIGRVQTDGGLLVGKVIISDDDNAGFHTVAHAGYFHRTSFEVLVHEMK